MFTYRAMVGSKYGMWLQSDQRFSTADAAQATIDDLAQRERMCGSSKIIRRVVAL